MKKRIILLSSMLVLCTILSGCGKKQELEEPPIFYSSCMQGEWQSTEIVVYSSSPLANSTETADNLVGKVYDLASPREVKENGGVVPIRDVETQAFFFLDFPYYLVDLQLLGNYYPIIHFAQEEYAQHPCLIVKSKEEMLVSENNTAIYRLQRIDSSVEQQKMHMM